MQFFVSIIMRVIFCTVKMECDVLTEQRINIKFFVNSGRMDQKFINCYRQCILGSKSRSKIKIMLIVSF